MKDSYNEKNKGDESGVMTSGDIDDLIFYNEDWHESER